MEDFPNYAVAFIASAPTEALTDEQFRQQVAALALAHGPHLLACTLISHRPAHTLANGTPVGEVSHYNVQAWDMSEATRTRPGGSLCFVVDTENPAACLAALRVNLSDMTDRELLALAADPTRFGNHQLASHHALAAAA